MVFDRLISFTTWLILLKLGIWHECIYRSIFYVIVKIEVRYPLASTNCSKIKKFEKKYRLVRTLVLKRLNKKIFRTFFALLYCKFLCLCVSSIYFESLTQVCPERRNNEEESTENKKERMYTQPNKYRDVYMYICEKKGKFHNTHTG